MKINKRNIFLDYIRGISAIMVVLYHYTSRYESLFIHEKKFEFTFPYGSYAVLMFFLLSGYFTLHNIEKDTPREYAIKRLVKLYPTYWGGDIDNNVINNTFFAGEIG